MPWLVASQRPFSRWQLLDLLECSADVSITVFSLRHKFNWFCMVLHDIFSIQTTQDKTPLKRMWSCWRKISPRPFLFLWKNFWRLQWHQITSVHTSTTSTFFQEIADLTGKFKNVGFLRKSFWNLVTSSGGNSGVRLDCAKISEGLGCLWKLTCYSNGKQLNWSPWFRVLKSPPNGEQ